jgi:hypothetical protein
MFYLTEKVGFTVDVEYPPLYLLCFFAGDNVISLETIKKTMKMTKKSFNSK